MRGGEPMRSLWLEILLRSDLCPATGEGVAGAIDMEIAHEFGLPLVPAKRIKGCLHEVAKDLCDCGALSPKDVGQLFGLPGQETSGVLHFYDARVYQVPQFDPFDDYEALVKELKSQREIKPAEVLNALTLLRTRTALEEDSGSAKDNSLRTMRVIKKGTVLRSRVDIDAPGQEHHLQTVLEKCVKGLRNMGLGRTRGLGEVRCSLTLKKMETLEALVPEQISISAGGPEEIELSYKLQLDTPLLISGPRGLYGSCEDWIPGSVIMGAFAGLYILEHQLGQDAHQDEEFARLFLRDGVKFGYAFPTVEKRMFYPCPASWLQVKSKDQCYDLAYGRPETEQLRGERRLVCMEDGEVIVHEPRKEVRMHHARPLDRGIGHVKGNEKPDEGQFFQYVSLSAGQTFAGTLRGKAQDIEMLLACLEKRNHKLRLGRSRTAEYGNVTYRPDKEPRLLEKEELPERMAERFMLWMIAPMVLYDEMGRTTMEGQGLLDEINQFFACGANLEKAFVKHGELGGYHTRWRLPKPQRQVLGAGSVLIIRTEKAIDLQKLENKVWGQKTGEGCGAVKAIALKQKENLCRMALRNSMDAVKKEEQQEKQNRRVHGFIGQLQERNRTERERERQSQEGRRTSPAKMLKATAIYQLIALFKQKKEYDPWEAEIEKIKDPEKRNDCLEFIKPCEHKSHAFIEAYLQNAKWKARLEG